MIILQIGWEGKQQEGEEGNWGPYKICPSQVILDLSAMIVILLRPLLQSARLQAGGGAAGDAGQVQAEQRQGSSPAAGEETGHTGAGLQWQDKIGTLQTFVL